MTLEDYICKYKAMQIKEMTEGFNSLEIQDRIDFLEILSNEQKEKFIKDIRTQAVADFWTHEQQLIKNGQCTRNWTPEQIEAILNISEKSGSCSVNGSAAMVLDEDGNPILRKYGDKWINEVYEGHHMLNVNEHPEYAGDWRNIQALSRSNDEHIKAHQGDFSNNTNWYYNANTGKIIEIVVLDNEDIFEAIEDEYPPKQSSIFKSDAEIKTIYSQCENLTDGELLALKNIELSMDNNGSLTDFNRGLDVAERYKSPDLDDKIGIMSSDAIRNKYDYFVDMADTDVDTFKAYEYFKSRKVDDDCIQKLGVKSDNTLLEQYKFLDKNDAAIDKLRTYEYQKNKSGTEFTDTKVYFDSEGKAIGLSCYDDVPSETALELRLSDTENYLSDTDMSSKYTDYDTYSKIDKLKACQYDYECTKISEMIDNDLSSQNDIELMSYEDLKAKYTFIDDTTDADVIKELQIAEYRDKKYGTTTIDDIKLYYDENGKMSCISDQGYESIKDIEIKANSKFSADVTEVNQYRNAEYMTTICPEYDNLTPLQKLQLQQLELDARNHDMSKLHDFVANDTAGNLKNVRITYDADGVVSGIDTSGINDGNVLDISKSNTIIDISSDGNVSMRLDKPSTGKAWWQDELVSIINNDSVKTINEITKRKTKGSNIGNIMKKVA